jgi:predicted GNAT family N-acyltransferase
MMPCGPRRHGGASARIAVPKALPRDMRSKVRELVAVKSINRGQGEAEQLLFNIMREADRTRTALFLHVEPEGDTEKARLVSLYWRHGFFAIQDAPLLMSRMPA